MPKAKTSRKKNARRKKVALQVSRLIQAMSKVRGTSVAEMRRILDPVGKAFGAHDRTRKELEAQIEWFYRYMNHQLNLMLADGYSSEEINKISGYLQGARTAFQEYGKVGVETCAQHLDDAAQALADLLELGPERPYQNQPPR